MHLLRSILAAWLFIFLLTGAQTAAAAAAPPKKPILYIPLDDRPVCLDYVVETMDAAGLTVLTPPKQLLASRGQDGDPAKLWQWLYSQAAEAEAIVVATDSLIYGGLVPSRRHELPQGTVLARAEQFRKLKQDFPRLRIYGLSTLMRTPRQSFGGMEPDYYEAYGPAIFRLTALLDKEETEGLAPAEKLEVAHHRQSIPAAVLQDWFARRQKNLAVNYTLIKLAQEQVFHYLVIGKDDNAPLSQTHREAQQMKQRTADIALSRFQLVPGVDQLGLVLLVRSIHEKAWKSPCIAVQYADGPGAATTPLYSDQKVSESVEAQIFALGCTPVSTPQDAQLLLAVNTPSDGITLEASHPLNLSTPSFAAQKLAEAIADWANRSTPPVAIADIAYANGADNGFLSVLSANGTLPKLAAYSGWNTADNKIGYALAQGLLAAQMPPEKRAALLQKRLLDDWAYQANIRRMLMQKYIVPEKLNPYRLGMPARKLQLIVADEMADFQRNNPGLDQAAYDYVFPWNRLFEIKITKRATG